MERRTFTREFRLEAVKLVREPGVTVAQAARDLGVHGNVLRLWVREYAADTKQAFPGQAQTKPISSSSTASGARSRCEVRVHREAPGALADGVVMRGARYLARRILCVAVAATKPARASRRGVGRQDPDEFSAEQPDLRRATRVA